MARRIFGIRVRTVLIGLLIAVVLGGAGAAAVALRGYHELTKIDRTEPTGVTYEYLRAALVDRDDIGAELYACDDSAGLAPIAEFRSELEQREREFDVKVVVSWGAFRRSDEGGHVLLTTELTNSGTKQGVVTSRQTETWRFRVVDDEGWRVCAAERLPDPSPTPAATPSL